MQARDALSARIPEIKGRPLEDKPLVSVIVPAYNEAVIIERNLGELCRYMQTLEDEYRWELIIVNDGSYDETGDLAEECAE